MNLNIRILPEISTQKQLLALADIDRTNFQCETSEVALAWANKFPWMYTLIERETPEGWVTMGYGLVIPTRKRVIEALRQGKIGEEDITGKEIKQPKDADGFYVASIGTTNEITTYESRTLVGAAFGEVLRESRPVVVVAVTSSGERIAREFGLTSNTYQNQRFRGVNGYVPRLLEKAPFTRNKR